MTGGPITDYTNLPYLYLIRTILTFLPILFVPLVPTEKTIDEVVAAVDELASGDVAADQNKSLEAPEPKLVAAPKKAAVADLKAGLLSS
eukprot:SAG11_NODE_863_length_6839_cov_4.857418_6_plen_89_part_00